MADFSNEALSNLIDNLRADFTGYTNEVRERAATYLRAVSPPFDHRLREHDQWADPPKSQDIGHARASFNETKAVVDLWSALEASTLPAVRWIEEFIPTPAPSLDEQMQAMREDVYRAMRLASRQAATMREQALMRQFRRCHMERHWFRAVRKKNIYGHSWLRVLPNRPRQTFSVVSHIDPSTVYPVWSADHERTLDTILVSYRQSARLAQREYPDAGIEVQPDGQVANGDGQYYIPTTQLATPLDQDRRLVWIEDLWIIDPEWQQDVDEGEPVRSRVINLIRANGKVASRTEYPGWRTIPYFLLANEDDRDPLGHSDAADMLPINDGLNRLFSGQQDVIYGESRPKFKFRGDSGRSVQINAEEVVSLDPDEDIEQIAVHLDLWPSQIHEQQLRRTQSRVTGLPPTVFGEITSAQNSGRALSTAWKATAARLVPRNFSNGETLEQVIYFVLDCMELYDWDSASNLYRGNRDFDLDFPNQEPRDPNEVTLDAINRLQAGITDLQGAMELTGEQSPDQMLERVRADYMDAVLHPEKSQAYLLLQRLKQQLAIEAQQAGMQAQAAQLQLAQMASSPPGGAPSGATPGPAVEQQAAATQQARAQAAAAAAPRMGPEQGAPAAQAGSPANPAQQGSVSTMIQNGKASNRLISQGPF